MSAPSLKVQLQQRAAGGLFGLSCLSGAAWSAEVASERYAALGRICGAADSLHCGWCLATLGLAVAGLLALGLSIFPEVAPAKAGA